MKSYNGLYREVLKEENIRKCFIDASKGKRRRRDVEKTLGNLDDEAERLKEILESETYELGKHTPCTINEHSSAKTRVIIKPQYKYEQVIHHCAVMQFKNVVMHGMYEFNCGSIPGRGIHYGKKYIEKWVKGYKGRKFYVLQMDIHHFFESVDKECLKAMLEKVIRDKRFCNLLCKIIDSNEKGLPLGFYTSQWFANFYLKKFDHFVKEELKAEHYIRYMDDMLIFGKNKKALHRMRQEIEEYLLENLGLHLKNTWQVYRFEFKDRKTGKMKGRKIDYMGFKFGLYNTGIRKSILKRGRAKANRITKKEKITHIDASSMLAFLGWFTHTNTYNYYIKYIKPKINVKKLKRIVSRHAKRERKKNEGMDKSNKLTGRSTERNRHGFIPDNSVLA